MKIVSDKRHWQAEIDSMIDDTLNVSISEDALHIEINEPWAGSTETGFGATCSCSIDQETAANLVKWITENYLVRAWPAA